MMGRAAPPKIVSRKIEFKRDSKTKMQVGIGQKIFLNSFLLFTLLLIGSLTYTFIIYFYDLFILGIPLGKTSNLKNQGDYVGNKGHLW